MNQLINEEGTNIGKNVIMTLSSDEEIIDNKWGGGQIEMKEKGISEKHDIRREREKLRGVQ